MSSSSTGFSVPGVGSGIDWSSYIAAVRKVSENAVTRTLGVQQLNFSQEQSTYSNIQGLASALQTDVENFRFSTNFKTMAVTSSNSTSVIGTAAVSALPQTFTINVAQLATNEQWQAQFASAGSSVTNTDQSLTINVRGTSHTINVSAGTTLTNLASQINSAGIGVTAFVFDTGAGTGNTARLQITDNTTGKASSDPTPGQNFNLSFSSTLDNLATAAFGNAPTSEGLDAKVFLNGGTDPIYRSSNSLTDVIPGVSLSLLQPSNGNAATITVAQSSGNAATQIQDFVSKYNAVVSAIKQATIFDPQSVDPNNPNAQKNPLANDATLRSILTQLQSVLTDTLASLPPTSSIHKLEYIGITTQFDPNNATAATNGTLTFDQNKFNQAAAANISDITNFFQGTTINGTRYQGFGERASTVMNNILDPVSGTLTSRISNIQTQSRRIQADILKKSQAIDAKEQQLKDQFARLETVMSQLNEQQSALSSAITQMSQTSASISKINKGQ